MEGEGAEGRGVSGTGNDEKLKGRGIFGACVEIGNWGVFGTIVDSREKAGPFDGKLPEEDLPNGPLDCGRKCGDPLEPSGCLGCCEIFCCVGGVVRPEGPDCPGIRITRPQRVQGLLLASHSFPQRGQIMIYPSLRSSKLTRRRSAVK